MIAYLLARLEKSVKPILTRYYILRSKYVGVKLHHIKESDPEFHTHPWRGISFHWRPYLEERWIAKGDEGQDITSFRRCRWFNVVEPFVFHRVHIIKPMWTLFIHGPRVNETWQYGGDVAPWRGPEPWPKDSQ